MSKQQHMRGITVQEPWASAIAFQGKDVENRTWPAPEQLFGKIILIHAGKGLKHWHSFRFADEWEPRHDALIQAARDRQLPPMAGLPLATAVLAGWAGSAPFRGKCAPRWNVDCTLAPASVWADQQQLQHVLVQVSPLPEELRTRIGVLVGKQGYWKVAPDVAALLLEHHARAFPSHF